MQHAAIETRKDSSFHPHRFTCSVPHETDLDLLKLATQIKTLRLARDGHYYSKARDFFDFSVRHGILPFEINDLDIMSGGRVNFLTARGYCLGEKVFIKVSKSKTEDTVFQGQLDGLIHASGTYYATPTPLAVVKLENLNIYLFRFIEDLKINNGDNLRSSVVARGLGEFAAMHVTKKSGEGRIPFLENHSLSLRSESVLRIQKSFNLNDSDPMVHCQRMLVDNWISVERRLRKLPYTLCVRDISRDNVFNVDGKAVLADLGSMHYAPIGFDLWDFMLADNATDQEDVIDTFHLLAHQAGIGISRVDMKFVALSAACIMMLDVMAGTSVRSTIKRTSQMQKVAASLIDIC